MADGGGLRTAEEPMGLPVRRLLAREYNSLLGGLAFLPLLFVLALPWLSFTVGCTSGISRTSGAALLFDTEVPVSGEIDSTAGTESFSTRARIPGQWPVRMVALAAIAGVALTVVPGWPGRASRGVIATLGAYAAWLSAVVIDSAEFEFTGSGPPVYAESDYGPLVAAFGFSVVALLNVSLSAKKPTTSMARTAGYLAAIHALAIPLAVALAIGANQLGPGPWAVESEHHARPGSAPNPSIPGDLLFLDSHACIQRAAASGEWREQLYCVPGDRYGFDFPSVMVRTDAGEPGYLRPFLPEVGGRQFALVLIDSATHQAIETGLRGSVEYATSVVSPFGDRAYKGPAYGEHEYLYIGTRYIAGFEHGFNIVGWSPDGQWLLIETITDTCEYWVFARDGMASRAVARDALCVMPSWWIDGFPSTPRFVVEGTTPTSSSATGAAATVKSDDD